jgi:hypothetical protein
MTSGSGLGWCLPGTEEMVKNIIKAGKAAENEVAAGSTKGPKPRYKNRPNWRARKRNRGHDLLKNC